jgi:predicted amidohydrolase YtcJ
MAAGSTQTFINGKVFTGRGEDDFVTSFAIADGRFTAIGEASDDGEGIDLGGRTVLPGLLDVHCHPTHVARIVGSVPCMVPAVNDIPGMVAALKGHPNAGKGAGDWIEGWGYDESKLAEHRAPTRADLDRVSAGQPVLVMRSDFHSAVVNSRALALAGITRDTPDPDGARIERDGRGEPTGVLTEGAAVNLVREVMATPSHAGRVADIASLGEHYGARGIVAVTDMMVGLDALAVYRDAEAAGFPQQAALYVGWQDIVDLDPSDREGRTRIGGVKLFADGTISGRTAWISAPYPDSDERGIAMLDDATMRAAGDWARRNGVQVAIHAMGDAALQQVIDHFADEAPWMDGLPSVRLEHASLLSDDQMRQMRDARMTFGLAAQVIFTFAEYDSYHANLTAAQLAASHPARSYHELVPHAALSSDAPATTWADPDNVFVSITAAVTRKAYNGADIGAGQAITVPQAVLLHTARAATTTPYEGRLGQIADGYEGSFAVLDRDIFTVDPGEIDRTVVEETWIAGERVHAQRG